MQKQEIHGIVAELDAASGIATITFNRAEAANAINTAMWENLPRLINKLLEDDARLLIFTGKGKHFAAGADFEDLRQITDYASAARFWEAIATALETIADLEIPTIAMINGPCLGGGCLLANACDLRFAALHGASFGIPIARLGIILDDGNIQRLVNLIGQAKAKEMLFSAATISSTTANTIGLINQAIEDEKLTSFTLDFAKTIMANSSLTVAATKASIARLNSHLHKADAVNQAGHEHERAIVGYLSSDFRQRRDHEG
ncbi:enoyl-CoA hydratase-related protein [soil metagenome]